MFLTARPALRALTVARRACDGATGPGMRMATPIHDAAYRRGSLPVFHVKQREAAWFPSLSDC